MSKLNASHSDILHMTATIWGEARGEYHKGKDAVAWVIRNRAERPRWWGRDITDVCTKKYQFSCWLKSDRNSRRVKEIAQGAYLDDPVVQDCMASALAVLRGITPDLTDGADHYFNPKHVNPSWRDDSKQLGAIGGHLFYKLED